MDDWGLLTREEVWTLLDRSRCQHEDAVREGASNGPLRKGAGS